MSIAAVIATLGMVKTFIICKKAYEKEQKHKLVIERETTMPSRDLPSTLIEERDTEATTDLDAKVKRKNLKTRINNKIYKI